MRNFDRIAGYETEKKELEVLVDIFNNRAKYREKGASLPKGIIFCGEKGVGKQLFATVLAERCALKISEINIEKEMMDYRVAREIRKAFTKAARNHYPTMILLKGLDKLFGEDVPECGKEQLETVCSQLSNLLDGMDVIDNIVFVATCEHENGLPDCLRRAGRFDRKITLELPDYPSRVEILRMYMDRTSCRFALDAGALAKLGAGFSGGTLEVLVRECALRSNSSNFVSEECLKGAVVALEEGEELDGTNNVYQTVQAVRNIGAFLASLSYHKGDYHLSLNECTVCNGFLDAVIHELKHSYDDDDYYCDDDDDEYPSKECKATAFSKNDLQAAVTSLLAGYAAEELILHKVHHTIAENMRILRFIFLKMVECGMLGLGHLYVGVPYDRSSCSQACLERLEKDFDGLITECYKKATEIVRKNEELIKKLTPVLLKHLFMEKSECDRVLFELGGVA